MTEAVRGKSKSDLKTRTLSAIAMIAVSGGALWAGGVIFTAFVAIIAAVLLWEYWGLVRRISSNLIARAVWMIFGLGYVGIAVWQLVKLRSSEEGDPYLILAVICAVIAVDIGAYAFGRTLGGPKIAPKISPSKTWAGLLGGCVGAFIIAFIYMREAFGLQGNLFAMIIWIYPMMTGIGIAVVAQAGDFFESWMKRRAGVKDSGNLIPGHGGVFDRLDGMLAVLFVLSLVFWLQG